MLTMEQNAREIFEEHIFSRVNEVEDLTHKELSDVGLQDENLSRLKLTHFDDIYDTLLYSRLIERALRLNPGVRTIIDLGAGSSIPSLLAMKNSGRDDIATMAVDIDPEASEIGIQNATTLGLRDKFCFYKGRMEDALEELGPFGPETLIVSNPPYIASPDHLKEFSYVPVNGGMYGDEFLLKILGGPYPPGVNFVLLWGSLTSPENIMPLILTDYEFLHTEAYKIHFGNYTAKEPLRSYLYQLKDEGKVFFEKNEHGTEVQYVFGTILRKKP